MIEGLVDAFKETGKEGTFLPHFSENLQSNIESFDDADKPLNDGESFVNPHEVDSYTRADGTVVDGYWRDGDGDTSVDLTKEEGGGYFRNI